MRRNLRLIVIPIFVHALICSCATITADTSPVAPAPLAVPQATPDAPHRKVVALYVIDGATVMTAAGNIYTPGYVILKNGLIDSVGSGAAPAVSGADVINAHGMFVTPGIIDTHSHMGVYANPGVQAHADGNEATSPTTPEVWAEHGFWPQDPSLWRAVAGGVTTIQVLPGSANLIGGRSFIAKLHPATSARAMRFPGVPQGLKMACGENPKRVYGDKGGPQTRMGNVAGYRKAFQNALEYRHRWRNYDYELAEWKKTHQESRDEEAPTPPDRDFGLETLSQVLDGKILVHNHCYRADEMHLMLDLAREFGFHIRSFHHALEAYKLRDRLAKEGVAVSTWVDWWGFKMEALDGVPQNAALLSEAGVRTVLHSDSEIEIRHLNQEAGKALTAGRRVDITLTDDQALQWITRNPAWALGVENRTGSLEVGKMADVVIWDKHPFSVYARAQTVFIDGEKVYERAAPNSPRVSDFEIGWGAP